jgi:hypothetical protein
MYDDIDLREISLVSHVSTGPLSPRKYESVKKRPSNISIMEDSIV